MKGILGLTLGFLLVMGNVSAKTMSHESIQKAVKRYVISQLPAIKLGTPEIMVKPLDARLKLNHCDKPLSMKIPHNAQILRATTLSVHCPSPKAWSIHVPYQIKIMATLITASQPLARGTRLGAQHLHQRRINIRRLGTNGYFQDARRLKGLIVTRPIQVGRVIQPNQVVAPKIIRRGEAVLINAKHRLISVTMRGVALTDGRMGQSIKIRNTRSKRVVNAIVTGPRRVEIWL